MKTKRLAKMRAGLEMLTREKRWTKREAQQVASKIMSCKAVLESKAWLHAKHMHACVAQAPLTKADWGKERPQCIRVVGEATAWMKRLEGEGPRKPMTTAMVTRHSFAPVESKERTATHGFMSTDASACGIGAMALDPCTGQMQISARTLSLTEAEQSSTLREMHATRFTMNANGKFMKHKTIILMTDNLGATTACRYGSRMPELQTEAIRIDQLVDALQCNLSLRCVPRTENERADAHSRLSAADVDDCRLTPAGCRKLTRAAGFTPRGGPMRGHKQCKTHPFLQSAPLCRECGGGCPTKRAPVAREVSLFPTSEPGAGDLGCPTKQHVTVTGNDILSDETCTQTAASGRITATRSKTGELMPKREARRGPIGRPRFLEEDSCRIVAHHVTRNI